MKKGFIIIGLLVSMVLVSCSNGLFQAEKLPDDTVISREVSDTTTRDSAISIGMPSPLRDSTNEELKEMFGKNFNIPDYITVKSFYTINQKMACMKFFYNDIQCEARFQKISEMEYERKFDDIYDISGCYEEWDKSYDEIINGCRAKILLYNYFENKYYGICIWDDVEEDFAFSVVMNTNEDKDILTKLSEDIFKTEETEENEYKGRINPEEMTVYVNAENFVEVVDVLSRDQVLPKFIEFIFTDSNPDLTRMPNPNNTNCEYSVTVLKECEYVINLENCVELEEIPDSAFCDYKNMKEIKLPPNVKKLGDHAFEACYGLTRIFLPNSITEIGTGTFRWCNSITGVRMSKNIEIIGKSAFEACSSLQAIVIPESTKLIKQYAFSLTPQLKDIKVKSKDVKFETEAFKGHGYCNVGGSIVFLV